MIKRIVGFIMICIGAIALIFFGHYEGDLIPFSTLWFILSFPIIVVGIILSVAKTNKQKNETNEIIQEHELLRKTGEKILVNLDFCYFKTNDFQQDVSSGNPIRAQAVDAMYDPSQNVLTQDFNQTVIEYNYINAGRTEQFISPVLSIDKITLEFHIMNNEIYIYVDKLDRTKYFFDLFVK